MHNNKTKWALPLALAIALIPNHAIASTTSRQPQRDRSTGFPINTTKPNPERTHPGSSRATEGKQLQGPPPDRGTPPAPLGTGSRVAELAKGDRWRPNPDRGSAGSTLRGGNK